MKPLPLIKRPALNEVLCYENTKVVSSFLRSFDVSGDDAATLFMDVKRMLWLCNEMSLDGLRENGKQFSIDQSLLVLDEMWHTFILFTADYRQFCFSFFGHFIEHLPTVEDEEEKSVRKAELAALSREAAIIKLSDEKRWQYEYVLKKLGREVFIRWYSEYHQKYTARYLLQLKLRKLDLEVAAMMQDA